MGTPYPAREGSSSSKGLCVASEPASEVSFGCSLRRNGACRRLVFAPNATTKHVTSGKRVFFSVVISSKLIPRPSPLPVVARTSNATRKSSQQEKSYWLQEGPTPCLCAGPPGAVPCRQPVDDVFVSSETKCSRGKSDGPRMR